MDIKQFENWFRRHCDLFPAFATWWKANRSDALRSVWIEQMAGVELADALEASKAMLNGEFDAEHPQQWDYNALPRFVAGVVRRIRGARAEAEQRQQQQLEFDEQRERRAHYDGHPTSIIEQLSLDETISNQQQDPKWQATIRERAMKVIQGGRENLRCRYGRNSGYVRRFAWALTAEDIELAERIDQLKEAAILGNPLKASGKSAKSS